MTEEVWSYLKANLTGHLSLARGERESLCKQHEGEETEPRKQSSIPCVRKLSKSILYEKVLYIKLTACFGELLLQHLNSTRSTTCFCWTAMEKV